MSGLAPMQDLFDAATGEELPLPDTIANLYGRLRMPRHAARPHVIGNFVASLDGVVSLGIPGKAGGGDIDPERRLFRAGAVPSLILTTAAGAERLQDHDLPPSARVEAVAKDAPLSAQAVLDSVARARKSDLVLLEAGPHLMSDFVAEQLLDELFLTLAPQVAGRDGAIERPGLVNGKVFAPDHSVWGTLAGLKRGGDHLFLRYAFARQ